MRLFNKLVILFMPLIPKPIVRLVSKPYVAGAKLSEAVTVVKSLNEKGIIATLDVLGESAKDSSECDEAVAEYFHLLDTIRSEELDSNISVKLSQLGLLIDSSLCYQNIKKIVQKAAEMNIFVRIDMEDSSVTGMTLDIFSRLQTEFANTGIVLQSYLRRSIDDITALCQKKTNFRICKGIYVEPRKIAYQNPETVNNNFIWMTEIALGQGCYVGIATHDPKLVWHAFKLIHNFALQKDDYEFQMLLGVDEELRDIIVRSGHRLRVYVPYGKNWYAYCVRRLKENPKIAFYVLKALLKLR